MTPSARPSSIARPDYRLADSVWAESGVVFLTGTQALVREVRRRTGDLEQGIVDVTAAVEEAIRTVKVWESEIRLALTSESGTVEVEGVENLPATLARFIAERQQLPGFSYEVVQDDVRGWVIRWKEMTSSGTVRGCGQFYERPYAWLDD